MISALLTLALLGAPPIQDLIDAKRWDDAVALLATLSPDARPRFEGLIAQGKGKPADAAKAFERALVATPGVPQLHLHAAHAYLQLARFEDVLRHAQAASALRDKAMAQPLLEARALEGLNRDGEAYAVLNRACKTFKTAFRPWMELAALAHRKKLAHDVRRAARKALALAPNRGAVLALFHLLYEDRNALSILEEIAARYPRDGEFRAHLGHVYARHRQWFSAARLFEEATTLGADYAFEAADQYRMAGHHRHALRMNGRVSSSHAQRAQRVAILFEKMQYARVVAMNATFNEPGSRYRVAYSHYAVGDYTGAAMRARALLDTPYRQEADALLEAIGRDSQR